MPRKSKQSTPSLDTPEKVVKQGKWWLAADAPWFGFMNVNVTDAEKGEFHEWGQVNATHIQGYLDDLVGEGMKYSAAWDAENECYIVTFTGALVPGVNVRCATTSRAGTWFEANALAVWKHYILMKEDYTDLMASGRKRSWG